MDSCSFTDKHLKLLLIAIIILIAVANIIFGVGDGIRWMKIVEMMVNKTVTTSYNITV